MTTVEEDRTQARIDGLLQVLRDAEVDFRRSYSRVLGVVAELDAERAGAVSGFGTTARLLIGVLNLSKGEAKARAEQAGLLIPRRSLTGEILPAALPATAAELAAGAISPTHVRVITATMRRIPSSTHPGTVAQAEQTLATMARRFDPSALGRIAERLLAHLDPDGAAPAEEPEQMRELRVRTAALGQRDKGCCFPSCDRPPRYFHAHHIDPHWLDGGETKIDNMCLLCEHHHVIVHRQGWHIRIDGRGRPEFTPPHTVDPTRMPLHDPLRQ